MKLNLDFSEIEDLNFDKSYNLRDEKECNLDAVVLVSESLGHHRVDSQLFNTYLGSIPLE